MFNAALTSNWFTHPDERETAASRARSARWGQSGFKGANTYFARLPGGGTIAMIRGVGHHGRGPRTYNHTRPFTLPPAVAIKSAAELELLEVEKAASDSKFGMSPRNKTPLTSTSQAAFSAPGLPTLRGGLFGRVDPRKPRRNPKGVMLPNGNLAMSFEAIAPNGRARVNPIIHAPGVHVTLPLRRSKKPSPQKNPDNFNYVFPSI